MDSAFINAYFGDFVKYKKGGKKQKIVLVPLCMRDCLNDVQVRAGFRTDDTTGEHTLCCVEHDGAYPNMAGVVADAAHGVNVYSIQYLGYMKKTPPKHLESVEKTEEFNVFLVYLAEDVGETDSFMTADEILESVKLNKITDPMTVTIIYRIAESGVLHIHRAC